MLLYTFVHLIFSLSKLSVKCIGCIYQALLLGHSRGEAAEEMLGGMVGGMERAHTSWMRTREAFYLPIPSCPVKFKDRL